MRARLVAVLRLDVEPHDRAHGAADQAHDVGDGQPDHVLPGTALALADRKDPVSRLEPAVLDGGAAGHEAADRDVAVVVPELRADALEVEAHRDREVLHLLRREPVGVRVVGGGDRVDERREPVERVHALHARQEPVVAPGELLDRLLPGQVRALEHQEVVLDSLAPAIAGFGRRRREVDLLLVGHPELVLVEVKIRREELVNPGHALLETLHEQRRDALREAVVALAHHVVEPVP